MKSLFRVCLAFVFAVVLIAPNLSSAQTSDEIQAQIKALLQQLHALQQQLAQQQGSGASCHTFNRNLRVGDRGDEVVYLQQVLEKEGFTIADADKAREGQTNDSNVFGDFTAAAASGFQEKYRDEILTPNGLKYGTGYVGKATRQKLNQLYGCGRPTSGAISISYLQAKAEDRNILHAGENTGIYGSGLSDAVTVWIGSRSVPVSGTSDSSINFTAPSDLSSGTVSLSVQNSAGQQSNSISVKVVGSSTGAPSITVLSPNGGEIWQTGSTQTIKWTSSGLGNLNVNLDVVNYPSGTFAYHIAYNIPNYGSTSWSLPADFFKSGTYEILISSPVIGSSDKGLNAQGYSAPFTITTSSTFSRTHYDLGLRNAFLIIDGIPAETAGFHDPIENKDFTVQVQVENAGGGIISMLPDISVRMDIYDATGNVVWTDSAGAGIDFSALSKGLVNLYFQTAKGATPPLRLPRGNYKAVATLGTNINDDPNLANNTLSLPFTVDPPSATSNSSITITSPVSGVSAKRNTSLTWTWSTAASSSVNNVDIYLMIGGKTAMADQHTVMIFATAYPNYGRFSWTVGYSNSGKQDIPNDYYTIAVCPAGQAIGSQCGKFGITIVGNTPVIGIAYPLGGEASIGGQTFQVGGQIPVSFTGVQYGDQYKIDLFQPAKGSDIVYNLGTVTGQSADISKNSFTIPSNVPAGTYQARVTELTNQGSSCVNVCALAESNSFTIATMSTNSQPTITTITPSQGTANTLVTVYGTNLLGTTEIDFYNTSNVLQTSIPTDYYNSYDNIQHHNISISSGGTQAQFVISGAFAANVTGALQVRVVTPAGSSNAWPFTITTPSANAPTITNITPNQGGLNKTVTIYGTNLSGASSVEFYTSSGQLVGSLVPSFVSATNLVFTISGAFAYNVASGTYQVSVVTNACAGGCNSNRVGFTLNAPTSNSPTITNISPSQGTANTKVTIYGTNLSGASSVEFYLSDGRLSGSLLLDDSSVTSQSRTFTISGVFAANAAGAGTYQLRVVTNACPGGCSSNAMSFMLTAPDANQ